MGSRFEHYADNRNEWRWRFTSGNGRIIAVSSEGYRSEADCLNGIRLVQTEATKAPINRLEGTKTHEADAGVRIRSG